MENEKTKKVRFALGDVYVTRGVNTDLTPDEIRSAICRHAKGDWGVVGKEDWEQNEEALKHNARLFSVYKLESGRRIWVITEADRSSTTVLFPEEY